MQTSFLTLMLITDIGQHQLEDYDRFLRQAIAGGVSMVQLREKNLTHADLLKRAVHLKRTLDRFNIPLLISDNVGIAHTINASGVHLGQGDMHPDQARTILGSDKIIGWSIESYHDLECANQLESLSYVTASAVFSTSSKTNLKKIWGVDGLSQLVQQSRHPMTAIGGIDESNSRCVFETGVKGIAVMGALHQAWDPKFAAKRLLSAL